MNNYTLFTLCTAKNIQKINRQVPVTTRHLQVLTDSTHARANQARKGMSVYFDPTDKLVIEQRFHSEMN